MKHLRNNDDWYLAACQLANEISGVEIAPYGYILFKSVDAVEVFKRRAKAEYPHLELVKQLNIKEL